MIPNINWSQPQADEPESPFGQGVKQRTLKLTFHSESFISPTKDEMEAIDMLRNFSNLFLIDAVDTMGNDLPKLTIGEFNLSDKYIDVTVGYDSGDLQSSIDNPIQWLNLSERVCNKDNFIEPFNPEVPLMLQDILVTRAHFEIGNDILITLSKRILNIRNNNWIEETNPLTPIEAVKLIGLFLRSKDNFTIKTFGKNGTQTLGKNGYYWVLARNMLPAMWKYFSACVEKSKNSPYYYKRYRFQD